MLFVTNLVSAPSRMPLAAVGVLPGFGSAGFATVTEDVAISVPVDWVVQTAASEFSVSAANYFASPACSRSAERYAIPCNLRRVLDHMTDPRLPRSPMRGRSNTASKLNYR